MAVQLRPPSAVATYIKKKTLVYNLCQELFLQFLSVRAAPWKDYSTLGAIYLFLFTRESRLVPGWKNKVCARGSVCSPGRLTHLSAAGVCFMGSPTASLLCSSRTSLRVLEPAHHSAACKQGGGVWQQIKGNTNYGKNLAPHSDKWRINGKMHINPNCFPKEHLEEMEQHISKEKSHKYRM